MKAMVIGGYPQLMGKTLTVYFDSPCDIDGVEEKLFRSSPPMMDGTLEMYFREKHLMFLGDGEAMKLDLEKVHDVEVEGIDTKDYPDFCDAYISFATYDGEPMSDEQLDKLNENRDFVYEHVLRRVY